MAGIGGYRSPVNLPIGRVPVTTDPDLFDEMTEVYNSVHLLNQYLDQLRIIAGGGGSGQTPDQTLPFNRFFVAPALELFPIGSVVSPSAVPGENGIIPGCLSSNITSASALSNFSGIALTAPLAIGDDVRIGVGPASIAVPGAVSGAYIWGYASRASNGAHALDGTLYPSNPGPKSVAGGTVYPIPVGVGIIAGYAMFGPLLWR